MNNLKDITIIIAALSASSTAFAQGHDHAGMDHGAMGHANHGKPVTKATPANAAATTGAGAVVKVNGLICDFCVQALTKTFRKQAAVRAVAVDLNIKEVRLGFKPGMNLDDATIGKLIKDAGYNVVSIARRKA